MAAFLPAILNIGMKAAGAAMPTAQGKIKKLPTKTPEQLSMLNRNIQMLGGLAAPGGGYSSALDLWSQMLSPESSIYDQLLAPYQQQFEQETVPMLAERFAGAGGGMGGALSSSGFGQSLGSAGGNLQTALAQLKAQLQQQAAGSLAQQYQQMFGQSMGVDPFMYYEKQAQPTFWQKFLGSGGGMGGMGGFGGGSAEGPQQFAASQFFG